MTNLKNTYATLEGKLRDDEKNVRMITYVEDGWYLIGNQQAELILSLSLAISHLPTFLILQLF